MMNNDRRFIWDENKNVINRSKHGVSFEDASSAFDDENAVVYYDEAHSEDEERFILLGMDRLVRILYVCYCYYESPGIIRIISARKATGREADEYYRCREK